MAQGNQRPDSMNEVISSVTHMLGSFENAICEEMTGLNVIYDQDLSYETGLAKFIEKSNYNNTETPPHPLFIYSRTITEDSIQGFGMRSKNTTGKLKIQDGILKYSCAYSEYDLNFLYVTHKLQQKEAFEVAYNSHSGISAINEITVDMGDLGEFKYFLNPLPLTDIQVVGEGGVTYKAIGGIIRVRGFFFVFEGSAGLIKTIRAKIYDGLKPEDKSVENILSDIEIKG